MFCVNLTKTYKVIFYFLEEEKKSDEVTFRECRVTSLFSLVAEAHLGKRLEDANESNFLPRSLWN